MKKLFTLLFLSFTCILFVMGQRQSIRAYRVLEELTIDGNADEESWGYAEVGGPNVALPCPTCTDPLSPSDLDYEFKVLFSDLYFYFFMSVTDDVSLYWDGTNSDDETYFWDSNEIYLLAKPNVAVPDTGYRNYFQYLQVRYAPLNNGDSLVHGHGWNLERGDRWKGQIVNIMRETGARHKFKITASGYNLEVAIPWCVFYALSDSTWCVYDEITSPNASLGFDVCHRDRDDPAGTNVQGVYFWNNSTYNNLYQDFSGTGQLILDEALTLPEGSECGCGTTPTGTNPDPFEDLVFGPNPFHDRLIITDTKTIERVVVSDLMGRVILDRQIHATSSLLPLEGLTGGVYLLTVESGTGDTALYKIMKQ